MKKIFFTLLTVMFCMSAFSQTVETIRKDYADALAHAKQINDPEYPVNNKFKVVTEQMMPGSGPHQVTANFYYYEDENEESLPDITKSIYYVTHSYNWVRALSSSFLRFTITLITPLASK